MDLSFQQPIYYISYISRVSAGYQPGISRVSAGYQQGISRVSAGYQRSFISQYMQVTKAGDILQTNTRSAG